MTRIDPALLDEAALWAVRTRDPSFTDWDAFTLWLEADPAANEAYEAALDAGDAAAALPPMAEPPRSGASQPKARVAARPFRFGAAAAALIGAVSLPTLLPRSAPYAIETMAGEQRAVRLADGTRIALNGGARLVLDRNDPRAVALDRGEATFTVVHDAENPFVLRVGDTELCDVGTVFNVVRAADATEVAVAEGAVLYDPSGAKVMLAAGATLRDVKGSDRVTIGRADPATIAAWRQGRLVYRGAPLGTVAADLSRATGQSVTVTPDARMRPFSGIIQYRGVPADRLVGRVGALTGLRVSHDGKGWTLSPGPGAPR